MKIEKPWGFEELVYLGEKYVFKRLFMRAGEACSLQYHRAKHETVVVSKGKLLVQTGSTVEQLEERVMSAGETVVIDPGVIHRMTALEDCVYFEASTPELDDVVRLDDRYGRSSGHAI